MNIIGIIPARMGSSRFPGKPLAKVLGVPMIGHVYFRSKMSGKLDEVYIATCDNEIKEYGESIGARVIMTSDKHQRASDRTAEAVAKIEKITNKKIDVIVMIQGDEPMLVPQMIDLAVGPLLKNENILVTNLMAEISNKEGRLDPNEIKVVVDKNNFALYFSREPIPCQRKGVKAPVFKQVCVIPFRRDFLIKFNKLRPTPLEMAESVDMLRILEHGYKVKMILTKFKTYSVDTISDLRQVEGFMKKDPLIREYTATSRLI